MTAKELFENTEEYSLSFLEAYQNPFKLKRKSSILTEKTAKWGKNSHQETSLVVSFTVYSLAYGSVLAGLVFTILALVGSDSYIATVLSGCFGAGLGFAYFHAITQELAAIRKTCNEKAFAQGFKNAAGRYPS